MGEGQYRVSDEVRDRLNELDDQAIAAVEAGDERTLDEILDVMFDVVRSEGERLPNEYLASSDVIVPPSDLTLEETKQLLSHEGFIPDIPAPS
jgi:hypothetical protein